MINFADSLLKTELMAVLYCLKEKWPRVKITDLTINDNDKCSKHHKYCCLHPWQFIIDHFNFLPKIKCLAFCYILLLYGYNSTHTLIGC